MIEASVLASLTGECLHLHIYDNGRLVWSHMYLGDGCTNAEYWAILKQIKADAENCADYADFDGCDRDDDGKVYNVLAENQRDIYTAADYINGVWTIQGNGGGTAHDFIKQVTR